MPSRIKLPQGWEKCRTGKRGVRKWRNLSTGCWVTDRDGDAMIHAGLYHTPVQYHRAIYTAQNVIDGLESASRKLAMASPEAHHS